MIGIYKITSPSGKVYIGQSRNIKIRKWKYKKLYCDSQVKLYRSLKKYGFDKHKFEVIHYCDIEELNELERYYQELYDCVDNGLNCFYTQTSEKPRIVSEETKRKMSIAFSGFKNSNSVKVKSYNIKTK